MHVKEVDIDIKPFLYDIKMGQEWYCEPYTKATLFDGATKFEVEGCFRHINCLRISKVGMPFDGFTCDYCQKIITCDDFCMRVYREFNAIEKRGARNTGKGRHLDYLGTKELRKASLGSRKDLKEERRKIWWLRAKVVVLSVRI